MIEGAFLSVIGLIFRITLLIRVKIPCISVNRKEPGESIIQQLLIRVFQLSGEKSVRRYYGEKSLILIQVPMLIMQKEIPLIKSEWINNGDSEKCIAQLQNISEGVWQVYFTREEGIHCKKIG